MSWWQLNLRCSAEYLEQVEQQLAELGALSISLTDAGDVPIYEPLPGQQPVWSKVIVTGTFDPAVNPDSLHQQLLAALPAEVGASLRRAQLQEQDWELAYQKHVEPMQFGDNLWVVPSWCDPPDPSATQIVLDPGIAFGTGSHATTALCLNWLATQSIENRDVIDYGCGSGILAIAAAKLGAQHVRAVDIDPQALLATKANAHLNALGEHHLTASFPEELSSRSTDMLLANILANPLIELAPRFAKLIRPGGKIMLSGLLKTQLEGIQLAYQPWFDLEPPRLQEDWVGLGATRSTRQAA